MPNRHRVRLRTALAVALAAAAGMIVAERIVWSQGAQAQTDDEKKKQERDRKKPPERRPPPPPPPKAPAAPLPPKAPMQKPVPPPDKGSRFKQDGPPPARDLQKAPPPEKDTGFKRIDPSPADKGSRSRRDEQPPSREGTPAPRKLDATPAPEKDDFKRPPAAKVPPKPGAPDTVMPTEPRRLPGPQGPAPKRFDEVQKGRLERVEEGGRRRVIQEPGNRTIVKQDNRTIIRHDEAERFRRRPNAKSERRADGAVETFYVRTDGTRIVTIVDGNGRLLRRYRRGRDGREYNIIDNRRFYRNLGVGIGVGVLGIIALNLPPPRITIPRDEYIVEYDRASDDDLYEALDAPPVEELERAYALEEIRDNYELRARMRRIDLDSINFEFGAWEVGPGQYQKLERVARAMLRVLGRNADAVFLIEGHTDGVGSDVDNLSLSDRRASAVAEILTETFDVPPENLVTQGYGEQHLKVDTQGPERLNRRVAFINITLLMAER